MKALQSPAPSIPAAATVIDPAEIGEAVYHVLLAGDETVGIEGDDRPYLQGRRQRADDWPEVCRNCHSFVIGDRLEPLQSWPMSARR